MAQVNIPPIVNDQGNINVHKDEGCSIPIVIQDNQGVEVDASTIPLFFTSGTFRKALISDSSDAQARMLVLTPIDLTNINNGASFRIVDESNPTQGINRWEGKIYKRG